MDSPIYQSLRSLINLIDELRDIGLHQYINLPRVCVVGTQSSGKSSVLESIIGLDFLPRGEGIVTRIPLELRLTHISSMKGEDVKPYAVFENDATQYTNFVTVKEKIEILTDEVAGKNKGIADKPVVISVFGPQVPDLTLIDLPGITRVPLRGSDQTDDIEKLTREMARRYVNDPRTIILAVIAANADMSTSDALQLARMVDPKGLRTIGVITKIDLMDRGTDAVKMLLGDEIPLRLGYTGVINRSQAAIINKKLISEALEEEKTFFQNNPLYRTLPSSVLGVHSLVLKVTRVLYRHIRHLLPDIKSEIDSKRRVLSVRLHELGDGVPSDTSSRAKILWSMITDYCDIVRSLVRGRYVRKLQAFFEQSELISGAQIRLIFNNLMSHLVQKNCTADMTDADVDTAIQMHEGDSLPGFPSPDTFEYLIRPHLMKIHTPAHDCLEQVHQFLEDICARVASRVFCRFPKLSEKVLEITEIIMLREKDSTSRVIENLIAAETGYLFTNDSNYLDMHGSMIKNPSDGDLGGAFSNNPSHNSTKLEDFTKSKEKTPRTLDTTTKSGSHNVFTSSSTVFGTDIRSRYSATLIQEIRRRLDSYFLLVVRNVRDTVPKCIGHFLIRKVMECMQFELYTDLNDDLRIVELLGEPESIIEERRSLTAQLHVLLNANQVLVRDPTLTAVHMEALDASFEADLKISHKQPEIALASPLPPPPPSQKAPAYVQPVGIPPSPQEYAKTSSGIHPSNGSTDHFATRHGSPPPPRPSQKTSVSSLFGKSFQSGGVKLLEKEPEKRQATLNNPLLND